MANLPISQLPEVTQAPEAASSFAIVQNGATSRIQVSNLMGPYITTGSLNETQTIQGFLQWKDDSNVISGYIASFNSEVGSLYLRSGDDTKFIAVYNDGISLVGNITSSGNISSSGNLIINEVTASGNISSSGYISASQIRTPFISSILGNITTLQSLIGTFGTATTVIDDNISSSGYVLANNMTASGNISSTNIITNNITASGNISASGTIFALNISSSGNVNFSGNISASNISASGWISGSDLVITNNSILGNTSNLDNVRITGSLYVSGSNIRFDNETNYNGIEFTGSTDFSRDVTVRDDLFVKDETTLDREVTIGYNGLSNSNFSYQLNVSASSNHVNSANFDGGIGITGSISASGNISASATISGNNIIAANQIQGNDLDVVTFGYIGDYLEVNNSITSSIISASGKLFGGLANTITPSAVYYNPIGGELSYGTGFTAAGISGSWQGQNFISASQVTENLPSGTLSSSNQITASYSNLSAATVSGSWQGQNFISASQVTENLPSGTISSSNQITASYSNLSAATVSGSWQGQNFISASQVLAGSTSGRVVYTGTGGILQTEAGFAYDATNDRLTVSKITTTEFTSSFITSSQVFSSGSNFLGDDTTDKQTLVGTVVMTGSAELTGSLDVNKMVSATTVSASLLVLSNLISATGTISSTDNLEAPQITGSKGLLIQKSLGEGTPTAGTSNLAIFQNNDNDQDASIAIVAADSKKSQLHFGKHDDIDVGGIRYFHEDDSTAPDVMRFRTRGANIASLWRGSAGNQSYFGVGSDISSGELPTDYFTAQGVLSGGGLLLSSSNGTGIIIDRGANTGLGTIKFKTNGFHIWTLGNITGENDDNFYIYNSANLDDKAISLISGSNSSKFHTNVTASGNISASGALSSTGLTVTTTGQTNTLVQIGDVLDDGNGTILSVDDQNSNVKITSDLRLGGDLKNENGTVTFIDFNSTTGQPTFPHPITASSDISASGRVTTNEVYFAPLTNDYIRNFNNQIQIKSSTESIALNGNVTASGNISSSGKLLAGLSSNSTSNTVFYNNTTGELTYGTAATGNVTAATVSGSFLLNTTDTLTGDLNVTNHITASGNISSSGELFAKSYTPQVQALTSAGAAAGTATTILHSNGSTVFATVGGAAQGFRLQALNSIATGATITIHNVTATAVRIYPPSGGRILPLGEDAFATLAANQTMQVTAFNNTQYVGFTGNVIV